MERNWEKIDRWYRECLEQIYPEPYCKGHTRGTKEVIKKFVVPRLDEIKTVVDVGCGQGVAARFFRKLGVLWVGVTLGIDAQVCQQKGLRVFPWDMTFIDFEDSCCDLVFGRHVIEHSPFPLFTLKEWHRLTRKYCIIVTPKPPFFEYPHPNHYSIMSKNQWEGLFHYAGFEVEAEDQIEWQIEYRWLLGKK